MTEIVGAAGGIGGFYLPNLLGVLRASTGTFASGFITFGALAPVGAILVTLRGRIWSGTFLLGQPTSYASESKKGSVMATVRIALASLTTIKMRWHITGWGRMDRARI